MVTKTAQNKVILVHFHEISGSYTSYRTVIMVRCDEKLLYFAICDVYIFEEVEGQQGM